MNIERFTIEIDAWIVDLRAAALRLHADGIPSEHVLKLASNIADGMAMGRAVARAAMLPGPGAPLRIR